MQAQTSAYNIKYTLSLEFKLNFATRYSCATLETTIQKVKIKTPFSYLMKGKRDSGIETNQQKNANQFTTNEEHQQHQHQHKKKLNQLVI